MRALLFCLVGLVLGTSSGVALADMKLSPKAAPGAIETRYFTSIDGLMNGNADVILKETRQGKTVTSAVLDVCYPAAKGSDRKDRFVVNLAVNGPTLTGTTQSLGDKLPVSVKLTRRPTGDTFEFKGEISVGQTVTEVTSSDNSDLSEKEFLDNQATDDGLTAAPKDFTEVSPELIGVRVKLDAASDFLKGLRGQDVELALSGLTIGCDALRAGQQTIGITVDPERAAALIAKAKSAPGVVSAGWTSGIVDMERTIRFPAADWRDGDKLNKDRLAAAIAKVLTKTLSAKSSSSAWSSSTGKAEIDLQAPQRSLSRARPHRHHRGDRAGRSRPARRFRPADAVDQQSRDLDGGRDRRSEAQPDRRIHRRRGNRPERRQRLGRRAGEGIPGPALGRGQVRLEIRSGRSPARPTHPVHAIGAFDMPHHSGNEQVISGQGLSGFPL